MFLPLPLGVVLFSVFEEVMVTGTLMSPGPHVTCHPANEADLHCRGSHPWGAHHRVLASRAKGPRLMCHPDSLSFKTGSEEK